MRCMGAYASLIALVVGPGTLESCSCLPPPGRFLYTASITVPSNTQGVPWWGSNWEQTPGPPTAASFLVEKWIGDRWVETRFELQRIENDLINNSDSQPLVLVIPKPSWRPGQRYRFVYRVPRGWVGDRWMGTWRDRFVEVSVGPTALVAASKNPTVSLTSQRRGPLQVSTLSGMCGLTIDAVQAELSMTLPADVEVWSLSLLYSTYVDVRQLWRPSQDLCSPTPKGTTWQGPGKDLLYAEAGAGPEGRYGEAQHKLAPGTHHVTMIAWLPGTSFRCQGDIDVTLNPN